MKASLKSRLDLLLLGSLDTDGFHGKQSKSQARGRQEWHQALCRKSEAGRKHLPGVGTLPAELSASLDKLGIRRPPELREN